MGRKPTFPFLRESACLIVQSWSESYGSLGTSIGLMMWLWISVIVVLVGGEINAELEHQTAEDTTTPPEKPRGGRGATMADTVGEAWR
jgi:membrane protein